MQDKLYGSTADEIMKLVKIGSGGGSYIKRSFTIQNHKGNPVKFDLVEEREDYITVRSDKQNIKIRR